MKTYRVPTLPYIGSDAKKLYQHENRAADAIQSVALALAPFIENVTGRDIDTDVDLYPVLIPEALASVINRFDHSSALAACIGYLKKELGAVVHRDVIGNIAIQIPGENVNAQSVEL